jgi:hypothetical protein
MKGDLMAFQKAKLLLEFEILELEFVWNLGFGYGGLKMAFWV